MVGSQIREVATTPVRGADRPPGLALKRDDNDGARASNACCAGSISWGGDVVEVSPPFDMSGNTALVGVTMMWEILCLLAEAVARQKGRI